MAFNRPMTAEEIAKELADCRRLDVYLRTLDKEEKKATIAEIRQKLNKSEQAIYQIKAGRIFLKGAEKETIEKAIGLPLFSMDEITVKL